MNRCNTVVHFYRRLNCCRNGNVFNILHENSECIKNDVNRGVVCSVKHASGDLHGKRCFATGDDRIGLHATEETN